jgi:hypothetical protein
MLHGGVVDEEQEMVCRRVGIRPFPLHQRGIDRQHDPLIPRARTRMEGRTGAGSGEPAPARFLSASPFCGRMAAEKAGISCKFAVYNFHWA